MKYGHTRVCVFQGMLYGRARSTPLATAPDDICLNQRRDNSDMYSDLCSAYTLTPPPSGQKSCSVCSNILSKNNRRLGIRCDFWGRYFELFILQPPAVEKSLMFLCFCVCDSLQCLCIILKCLILCVRVELYITAQSDPVMTYALCCLFWSPECHHHENLQGEDTKETCVCIFNFT